MTPRPAAVCAAPSVETVAFADQEFFILIKSVFLCVDHAKSSVVLLFRFLSRVVCVLIAISWDMLEDGLFS